MNIYTGSNFDDFLAEEGILEEVSIRAHKRLLAIQAQEIMEERDNQVWASGSTVDKAISSRSFAGP